MSAGNNPALSGEPGPGGTCRVCDGRLAEGSLRCATCGAVYGEANRCPHCHAIADVEPHAGGTRCKVCGGPRIVASDPAVVRTGREIPLLVKAERARMRGAGWSVGSIFLGAATALAIAVATLVLLVASPGLVATAATVVALGVPMLLALLAWSRARAAKAEAAAAVDEAWTLVASDALRGHEELSAADLARLLRVPEPRAESLLARLGTHDFVRARVTDAGDLAYSDLSAPRVRVETPALGEPADETASPEPRRGVREPP